MNPLEFAAVVLPSPGHGHYCIAELTTPKRQHAFGASLEEIQPQLDTFLENDYDTYLAMSTFNERGSREAANAAYIKCIYVDIDCNHSKDIPDENGQIKPKEYPSAKDAVLAVQAFLDESGLGELGQPWLASSGGGVHAYWPLTETVDIETWRPIAENLKALARQYGLRIDNAVTSDPARVMRLPGTKNNGVKGKRKVRGVTNAKLVSKGDTFDLTEFGAAVRKKLKVMTYEEKRASTVPIPGDRPKPIPDAAAVKMFANSVTHFKTIWLKTDEGKGCGQLKYYADNATQDGLEPLWRGLLSWAKCCEEDGWDNAVKLSRMHPYDPDRMRSKWEEIKGPYPCTKMDSENPGVCEHCQHFGKITNPLILGKAVATETEAKPVTVSTKDASGVKPPVEKTYIRPNAPRGFTYGKNGGVYMQKEDEDADGKRVTREVPLLPYDLFVVDILQTEAEHLVHMLYARPDKAMDILLPQKAVVSKDETLKGLAGQNVIAMFGAGNDKNLFEYVRQCVADASVTKPVIRVPSHYGWQEDDSFVHNGKIYSKNTEPTIVPMPELSNLQMATNAVGALDDWRSFIQLLIAREQYDLLAIALGGLAAPFMRFTKLHGITFHVGSSASGTGKSLALDAAASFWGRPSAYRVSKKTSDVAMQQRLGMLHSEPIISDEITMRARTDMDWVPGFIFDMSEGKGKERMESGTNRERINTTFWSSTAILSSNTHLVDMLTGAASHSSQGELKRLLEWTLEKELTWTPEEIKIVKRLQDNAGVVAPIIIQYMVDNVEMLEEMAEDIYNKIFNQLKADSTERFWVAGVSSCMLGGIILSSDYAGIVDLPLKNIMASYKATVEKMRRTTKESKKTADDILHSYVREFYGSFISVRYVNQQWTAALGGENSDAINQSLTRSKVCGRVEFNVTPGYADFYIEEKLLRSYCASMSYGYEDMRKQLEAKYPVSHIKKDMTAKTQGPSMRVNALKISQRLEDVDEGLLPLAEG
jgi:hypothetical protein